MDLAQTLVRMVMRAFYGTREIIILDAVITHSCLRDDDLALLASTNKKDLKKLLTPLKDDRLIRQHERYEMRENQARPTNTTYFYIDYRQAIDVIKWRVFNITKDIQGSTAPASEKKEYFCNYCSSEWTQMEVLDNVGPRGFICHRCNNPLVHDIDRHKAGHEQATRLNNQFKFVTDLLQQIDQTYIPDNTFDVALGNARPVVRDATNPGIRSVPLEPGENRPTAVKGLANVGPKSMAVNISTADGLTEAEKAAELARKEKIAQQNALPAWMSNSTITGESYSGAAATANPIKLEGAGDVKDTALGQASIATDHGDIEDVFARLKAEQEQKEREEEEFATDDDDDDDDEEEDFEDVVGTAVNSNAATPAPGIIKTEQPPSNGDALGDERPAKKVKVESPVPSDGEEESDEDVEFEDV